MKWYIFTRDVVRVAPVQEMARGKTNLQDREKSGSFSLSKGKLIVTLLIYM